MEDDEADPAERKRAFTEAAMQAWFNTALESTKSIFTMSSAGVGLDLTLAFSDAAGKYPACWAPVWLVLSAVLLACSSWLCILVFTGNKRLVGLVMRDGQPEVESAQRRVRGLDAGSKWAFALGLVFMLFALVAKTWLT